MIINASYISEYTSTYYLHRFRIHTISTNQSLTFNVCICVWLARSRWRLQICCIKLRVDRKTLAETFSFWLSCTHATHAYIHTHTHSASWRRKKWATSTSRHYRCSRRRSAFLFEEKTTRLNLHLYWKRVSASFHGKPPNVSSLLIWTKKNEISKQLQ